MPDILTDLALYCPFESNGNDFSGNGRHLTMTGTVPHAPGRIGNGCSPTSTNFYNFASPTWFDSKSAFTVAFWCKDSAYVASEAAVSYGTASATTVTAIYPFDTTTANGLKVFSNNVNAYNLNDSRPALGSWQFVCLVVESTSSAKLYINGDAAVTYTATSMATAASQTHFRVGHYHNGGQSYTGEIDELRVYLRALSAGDVAALYAFTGQQPQTVIF